MKILFRPLLVLTLAGATTGEAFGQTAPLDTAALSAALDAESDWLYSGQLTVPTELYGIKGVVEADYAHRGPSVLRLDCYSAGGIPTVSRTITGPGVARVWSTARGSGLIGATHTVLTTRMRLEDGFSAVVTITGLNQDAPFTLSSWQLLELRVPEGTHRLHLETLPQSSAPGVTFNYGYFDDFSFVPNDFILEVSSSAQANVGVQFTMQPTTTESNAPITFSLNNHPAWLSIDTHTGTIEGTPTTEGPATFTIVATSQTSSHSRTVNLDVGPSIGEVVGQPGWEWRTSSDPQLSWGVRSIPSPWGGDNSWAHTMGTTPLTGAWLEATAHGPGWVEWLQIDPSAPASGHYDWPESTMSVLVDGVTVGEPVLLPCDTYGLEANANPRRVYIPRGSHTIRWVATTRWRGDRWGKFLTKAAMGKVRFTPGDVLSPPPGSLSYPAWALPLPEASREPDQDGDGDGISNWEEYAFGPQGAAPVECHLDPGWATFRTRRFAEASECHWELEFLYPEGWSAAFVWDHATTGSAEQLEFRLSTQYRLRSPPPATHGGSLVLEMVPPNPLLVRFKVTRR